MVAGSGVKGVFEDGIVLIIGMVKHSYSTNRTPLQACIVVHYNGIILVCMYICIYVSRCTCMAELTKACYPGADTGGVTGVTSHPPSPRK